MQNPIDLKVLFATLLTIAVTVIRAGDCNPLSGEIRIGKDETEYQTVAEAVAALKCGGVSGPVTFLIEDGTYPEKLDLSAIQGASAQNTVSFESARGNSSDVVLTSSSPDAEYTLRLYSAGFVTFSNITIENRTGHTGNTVKIDGACRKIRFNNVSFNGSERPVTGANNAVIYCAPGDVKSELSFEDCSINNGSTGIYMGGSGGQDNRTSITGCLFFNQYESAVTLYNENAPVLTNNVISSVSTYKEYRGLYLNDIKPYMVVSNNVINAVNGVYGIVLNNCEGTPDQYATLSNNAVNVGGEGTMYGIYLSGTTDNVVLNFNRIKLTPGKVVAANQGFYKNAGSGANINLLNDIFFDLNTGGYTIIGNTYKDFFNQLPAQSNPSLNMGANGISIEKVMPANK